MKAIDCLVNVHFGESEKQPSWMLKVRDDYFKGPKSMFEPVDLAELLDEMDEQGVQKAILMDSLANPSVTARKFVAAQPDRFEELSTSVRRRSTASPSARHSAGGST